MNFLSAPIFIGPLQMMGWSRFEDSNAIDITLRCGGTNAG